MDAPPNDEVWRELLALRARVERLEAERRSLPAAEEPVGEPELSFVQPVRPSLESRIGSQLLNRVGIVALLIGAAWFLKYAVDREWLGPGLRVSVGLAAGLALTAWSERFRRRGFPIFGFSLKAAGAGLLYLSLWAAYSLFHLVPFWAAFAGMVVVTAANVWVCAAQQSEALAAVAMAGGFLTPALLGASAASVWVLGSYLLLLNAGLLSLLWRFRWPRLLPGAFLGTQAYLAAIAVRGLPALPPGEGAAALGFAGLFFAAFAALAALLGGGALAGFVLIGDGLLGAAELWRLAPSPESARWAPAVVTAWFALLLFGPLRTRVGRAASLLAGLVVSFAAVAVWATASGGGVVLGWGLEAAALLLLTRRSRASGFAASPIASAALLGLSAVWLAGLSIAGSLRVEPTMLLNPRFALFLFLLGLCVLNVRFAARPLAPMGEAAAFAGHWRRAAAGASLLGTALLLLAGVLEVHGYWQGAAPERFADSAWAGALGLGLLLLGFRVRWAWLRWQGLGLLLLAVAKVFVFDIRALSQGFVILSFLGLGVLLLLASFIYQRDLLGLRGREHEG